jgi:diketogulonate reductase-like aldo/keto reductase
VCLEPTIWFDLTTKQYLIKTILLDNPEPTWRILEKLYKTGKARSIGVSNWTISGLETLLECAEIRPAINQIEIHPFLPNTELVDYCLSRGILPVAYSPLGSQEQAPSSYEVFVSPMFIALEVCSSTREYILKPKLTVNTPSHEKVLTNAELNALALKKGVTLAQLLIAWGIKRGYAVLPKSANLERIGSNSKLIDLSEEDFTAVNKVADGRNVRFVNPEFFGYEVWGLHE